MDDIVEYLSNVLEDFDFKKLIFPTIIILLLVASFVYLITKIKNIETKQTSSINIAQSKEEVSEYIYVDIKGSVVNPGVYKIKSDLRVNDAIKEAGGILKDANTRFINLSKSLNDGDVIVVYSNDEIKKAQKENIIYIETPCVCEEVKNDACYKEESKSLNGKININTASLNELILLNGVGQSKAQAIIEYRQKNGSFKSIEQIKDIPGISESVYSKIKENITV